MVTIDIIDDLLKLEIQGWHKLWAFKRRIDIPLANITRVYAEPATKLDWWKGWRLPGTHIPSVIIAGTFYKDGQRHFWDVRNTKNTIVLDLEGHYYQQLNIEVANPAQAVDRIQVALSNSRST
jgi:hypothetical protein